MSETPNRREFISTAAVSALTASSMPHVYAGGNDTLRIGLVGCGGRGTGAAREALRADPNVKLVAMCDVFMDRLQSSLNNLLKVPDIASKIDVPPERCFDGFDGYKKLLECVDVVLLCTPPGFRPLHLRAAIDAGKHVFCEKPLAVDVPGVHSVVESARLAKKKGLALCSGFCFRYDQAKRETIKRLHDGIIGDIRALHITYLTGPLWWRGQDPKWTEMEYQMRNWYYFTWLSGDFIVEQHCHNFDKANWVLQGATPISAIGVGGRQVRTDPKYGNIYDHFAVTLEFPNGVKIFSACRQMPNCPSDINDHIIGTQGQCHLMRHRIERYDGKVWEFSGEWKDMYQVEHDELFASIRSGKPINDGESAAHSTALAIFAREAAYTGQRLTWKQFLDSKTSLAPKVYAWGPNPVPPVPMPGVYRLT
jgi:predicted dehydrogenase